MDLQGFTHANPVPAASRIGPFLASGALTGRDPVSGEMPPSLDEQCVNAFVHVRELMAAAGSSPDDILKVTVHLVDYRERGALNREWLALFPNAGSRPARQVMKADLDGGALIHVDLIAVLSDRPGH
ncbi:RidA family protein [Microbacterium sp.]|uniref:RidA family protein n=1 Tax=Microbacterium sp. TaxID=51671 RepID=UPI00289CB5C3|nr:RidA family protein [Microbacterium sp.]